MAEHRGLVVPGSYCSRDRVWLKLARGLVAKAQEFSKAVSNKEEEETDWGLRCVSFSWLSVLIILSMFQLSFLAKHTASMSITLQYWTVGSCGFSLWSILSIWMYSWDVDYTAWMVWEVSVDMFTVTVILCLKLAFKPFRWSSSLEGRSEAGFMGSNQHSCWTWSPLMTF